MPAAEAKKWLIQDADMQINTGTDALPVWTEIEGINTVTLDPAVSDTDLTDFNSGGHVERFPVRRSWTLTVGGFHMEDPADGARPVGQAAVEAARNLIGSAASRTFQVAAPSGKGLRGPGYVNITGPSGGNDDGASWGFTVTSTGALNPIP